MTASLLSEPERRQIEVIRLWVDSMYGWFDLEDARDGGVQPDVPRWVKAVSTRLDGTLFAPVRKALESPGVTAYQHGYALGIMFWGAERFSMKLPPELRAATKRIRLSRVARKIVRKMVNDFLARAGITKNSRGRFIPANSPELRHLKRLAKKYSLAESSEYYRGYSDGLRGIGQAAPEDRSTLATDVHLTLLIWWRFVKQLESIAQLHLWLCRVLSPAKVGDLKRVEKIAQRIGLNLRPRGRPKKIQTPMLSG